MIAYPSPRLGLKIEKSGIGDWDRDSDLRDEGFRASTLRDCPGDRPLVVHELTKNSDRKNAFELPQQTALPFTLGWLPTNFNIATEDGKAWYQNFI